MNESLQAQIKIYLSHLEGLIGRGRQLRNALAADPTSQSPIAATRAWQEDCGVTINQLSGGSKAHWLARSFSDAFLMRAATGRALEGATPDEIVKKLLDVLEQAVASLSQEENGPIISSSPQGPPPHRFEFVHNAELRPVLEQAYLDSRRALEEGHYDEALPISCGILEAIVTDALEHYLREHQGPAHKAPSALAALKAPAGTIADWPFETRLAVAERAGLIRSGCARLPPVARTYRDHGESDATARVSEREARQTGQVLHVIMRDLDPGR
ncbi:MAG: hypothetical protein WA172_22025 [Terriglobales bacterium]